MPDLPLLSPSGPGGPTLVFAQSAVQYRLWAKGQHLLKCSINRGEYADGSEVRWITSEDELSGWHGVRIVYLPGWHEFFAGRMLPVHDAIQALRAGEHVVYEERGTA